MKPLTVFFILVVSALAFLFLFQNNFFNAKVNNIVSIKPSPTPEPTPIILKEALPADAYTIVMVGDSMTAALGPDSRKLREYLKVHYPNKVFGIFNLAEGSTNILSLQEKLDKDIINSREFEVILIESYGYNPLSGLPLEEGLKKQTEVVDKAVNSIRKGKMKAKVNSIVVFVATIAPNRDNYGKGAVDLTVEKRREWADERSAYIKNHIKYAQDHNIPLINVYEKSLNAEGTGNLDYIEGQTFIHPSEKGVDLISKEIADYLFNNEILPQ